eukprot:5507067-Alexandrium_andersonii.AAC.1
MDGPVGLAAAAARRGGWGGPFAAGVGRPSSIAGVAKLGLGRPEDGEACCRCGGRGPTRGSCGASVVLLLVAL